MYNSGISVKQLVEQLKSEISVSAVITDDSYVQWINTVEQTVYSEVIRELRLLTLTDTLTSPVKFESIPFLRIADDESYIVYDDIHKVFANGVELAHTTIVSGYRFNENAYWRENNGIGYRLEDGSIADVLEVYYHVRPKLKTIGSLSDNVEQIRLPPEWIELVSARCRGEAYKLSDADELAAKWLNDYNIALGNFKLWVAGNTVTYGE